MIKFSSFCESDDATLSDDQKVAVYATGRMNPPTKGHMHLVNFLLQKAKEFDGDAYLFPTKTFDGFGSTYKSNGTIKVRTLKDSTRIKNPLRPDIKLKYIRELLQQPNIVIDLDVNAVTALRRLHELGYTDLIYVAGGDYFDGEPNDIRLVNSVLPNEAARLGMGFTTINAGSRSKNSRGISGYKASYAREAALTGDIGTFRAKTGWMGDVAVRLMKDIRQGLGL